MFHVKQIICFISVNVVLFIMNTFLVWLVTLFAALNIKFSRGCAWTAIYCYTPRGRKYFHFGIDPTAKPGVSMDVFGSITGYEWRVRIKSPVTFADGMMHPSMMPVYMIFTSLQYGLDRRYGWFRERKCNS